MNPNSPHFAIGIFVSLQQIPLINYHENLIDLDVPASLLIYSK